MTKCFAYLNYSLAFGLMALNLYGCTQSLEGAGLDKETGAAFVNDRSVSHAEFIEQYPIQKGEPLTAYVDRLQQLLNRTVVHFWYDDKAKDHYHRWVPAWENYWLYLAGFSGLERFQYYEFYNWEKALERGIGTCSQAAAAITGILTAQRIPARVVKLAGHVVAEAQVAPDTWWILDADEGVTLPFDLTNAPAQESQLRLLYENRDSICSPEYHGCSSTSQVVGYYTSAENNRRGAIGIRGFSAIGLWIERLSYLFKWLLPLLLFGLCWVLGHTTARAKAD